jgi:hypothetical protein
MRDVVGLTLVLEHRDARDVESLRVAAGGIVERDAREISLDVAGDTVSEVLVHARSPFSDEAHLRARRGGRKRQQQASGEASHGSRLS